MNTERITEALVRQAVEAAAQADAAFLLKDTPKEAFHRGAQDATAKALALITGTDHATAMDLILAALPED